VERTLRDRAEQTGAPLSRMTDEVLRAGFAALRIDLGMLAANTSASEPTDIDKPKRAA
jgi:hypothetical protein